MMSPESKMLDDKVLTGEMERLGYKGDIEQALGKFYQDATGKSFKPSKVVQTAKKITPEGLAAGQKAVAEGGAKVEKLLDIELESSLDAVRNSERILSELEAKQGLLKGAKATLFEDTTKKIIQEFDNIEPSKLFNTPQAVNFFANKLLPALKKQKGIFSKETGMAEDMLLSWYFPSVRKESVKEVGNFVRSNIKVGKEGYLKQAKGILKEEDVIMDPVEAYALRSAEVARDGFTKEDLSNFVKEYGHPMETFKDAFEAKNAGFRVIKEKGMFGKEVGYLNENDYKLISELFDPSFKTIDNLAKATGFDFITSLFKKSVTGLFAPFHVRNFVSGIFQNYEVLGTSALNPKLIVEGQSFAKTILSKKADLSGNIVLGGQKFVKKELVEMFRKRFNITSQYIADFGIETQKTLTKNPAKYNPFELAKNIGNYIETQQKGTAFLGAIKKGYEPIEALRLAENAGFDYSKLAPFEKHVMRRIIPFYAFTRKNLELQLKTLVNNPERLSNVSKVFRSAGTPQGAGEEDVVMPVWMRNNFVASLGLGSKGLPQVISGFGTPVEAVAQLGEKGIMGFLSMLNPIFKVPMEQATGQDFFREKDIKDTYDAREYSNAPKVIKDWLKIVPVQKTIYKDNKPTKEKYTVYVADPERLHIARNLFTSRGVSYLDTLFGESELSEQGRIIKSITGLKPYTIDEQTVTYFEQRDNARDMKDLMIRLGLIKTFETTYVPKEKKTKLK
jgi:hypothetical protein